MGVQRESKIDAQTAPASLLAKWGTRLNRTVDLLGVLGSVIAGVMLTAMMFLTFLDVAGRKLIEWSFVREYLPFLKPIDGSLELTEFMMALLVAFGFAYTAMHKGHIRVDLFMQYATPKIRLFLDIFAYGVSFIFYAILVWQSWLSAWSGISSRVSSSVLSIPIYPFIFLVVIGAAILVLVFLRDFIRSIAEVARR
jgi:TRAP-type C4-dicarboxylate transport system permease small subunit